jgi:ABC-2 type transport system permease protein
MRKVWVVIRREFLTRVRTKVFIISTLLGPVLIAAFMVIPILFADRGGSRSVGVLDATTSGFGQVIVDQLNSAEKLAARHIPVPLEQLEVAADSLARVVGADSLDGFLILTDAAVERGRAEYRGENVTSFADMGIIEGTLRSTVFAERLRREGVDPAIVSRARIPVQLTTIKIRQGEVTGESGEASFFLAYVMWFVLYISILLYGAQVMGSVVEEKQSRVVEVLISSLKPFQLLFGKVVGVGAVGLLQLAIWAGFAKLTLENRGRLAGLVADEQTATALASMGLPSLSLGIVVVFLTYFVLGYFLYASMLAAVAAMVNSEAEARQAQTPVIMLLVIPAIMAFGILNNPDGGLAISLSVIPFSSPIAMPMRWVATPVPLVELSASVAVLILSVMAVSWVAGRIYRVGILAYGKKPGVKELVRWVRG